MDLNGLTGVVGLVALVIVVVDFLRNLTSGKARLNAIVTQLCAWVGGLVAVFLYGESQLGDTIKVGEQTLDHTDTATKVIIGLMIASIASTVVNVKKALDSSDSAVVPPLLPPKPPEG
jgi:hypothetical protein